MQKQLIKICFSWWTKWQNDYKLTHTK